MSFLTDINMVSLIDKSNESVILNKDYNNKETDIALNMVSVHKFPSIAFFLKMTI